MGYTGKKPTNVVDVSETQSLTVDGDLTISDKIIHSGDTNTAIRFAAADTVTVETGGTEALRIDSSQNVGIGDASPDSTLHVNSGSANTAVTLESTDASVWQVMKDDTASLFFGNTGGNFALYTSATERIRVLSGGGLTFNGDTAAANALDDYEEGTFTPVFTRASSGFSTTPTYSAQDGAYVKIGSLVHAEIEIRFNNSFSGGSGDYLVRNLPFSNSGMANLEGISWGLMTVFNHTWSFSNTFAFLSGTDVHFGSGMGLASNTNEQYLTFTIQYRSA